HGLPPRDQAGRLLAYEPRRRRCLVETGRLRPRLELERPLQGSGLRLLLQEVGAHAVLHLLQLGRTRSLDVAEGDEGVAAGREREGLRRRLSLLELEGARDQGGTGQGRRALAAGQGLALLALEPALAGGVLEALAVAEGVGQRLHLLVRERAHALGGQGLVDA